MKLIKNTLFEEPKRHFDKKHSDPSNKASGAEAVEAAEQMRLS